TTYPLTNTNCGSTEIFTKAPERVLTEGASAMNVLLLQLGLKDKIVKTTSFSTLSDIPGMSAQLESLPRVKVASLGLSREEEIALAPDVVIAGQQSYFESKKGFATREQLHAAGIQAYAPNFFCANNVDNPTPEALVAQNARTFEDDLKVITELGQIFNVNDRAAQLVADIRRAYDDTRAKVASLPTKRVTVLEPSSAKPNAGVLYVYGGTVLTELITAAGGTNVWADQEGFASVSKEAGVDRPADLIVVADYDDAVPLDQVKEYVKTNFPDWPAARNDGFVVLHDTTNFQVTSTELVQALAKALHPEAVS
ncbi:MAG: ABC transporter substrate-binding protein, partial [Pseudonocardiaceae bacterium]